MLLVPVVDKYLLFGLEIFPKLKLLLVGFLVYVIRLEFIVLLFCSIKKKKEIEFYVLILLRLNGQVGSLCCVFRRV